MMMRKTAGAFTSRRRGFTLVELAIVMAVAALMFAGLWKIMASSSTQMRDQSAADMHRQVKDSIQSYLNSTEGQDVLKQMGPGATCGLPLPGGAAGSCVGANAATIATFLPLGFDASVTKNAYGQVYSVAVLRKDDNTAAVGTAPKVYSYLIGTTAGDVIPDSSGGRIASLIGNDGGFRFTSPVCDATAVNICGAYGAWSLNQATVFGGVTVPNGRIASRTFVSATGASDAYWLARKVVPGEAIPLGTAGNMNTLETDIALAGDYRIIGGFINPLNGTKVYRGKLEYFRKIETGRNDNFGGDGAGIKATSPCLKTGITDTTCDNALEVQGDASVSGLLASNKFSAEQYIYQTSASDERLKKEIAPISNPLDRLSQLNGYSFQYTDGHETRYGVLAQEVEKVFPEIVHEDTAGNKSVDYMGLVGPLVAAVRQLKEENEKLRGELTAQKQQINELHVMSQGKKK